MPEEDWAISGSFMDDESLPPADDFQSSHNDASQRAVASSADDKETKVTDEDFSKM